jgi:hypothetical protein
LSRAIHEHISGGYLLTMQLPDWLLELTVLVDEFREEEEERTRRRGEKTKMPNKWPYRGD